MLEPGPAGDSLASRSVRRPMGLRLTSAIAANRFGLGARPGDLSAIGGDGRDWLRAQLKDAAPQLADPQLRSSSDILAQALELRREIRASRQAAASADDTVTPQVAAQMKVPQLLRPIYVEEATARFRQAVTTDRPFVERLTQFWTNHFAVSVDKNLLLGLAGSLEREAIRPHVLGNFSDMLLAVESHPAMLLYLDNHLSVGPNSKAARNIGRRHAERKIGINENLARETLELHTLGVGGGYTQADVTSYAEVITGWSIGGEGGRRLQGVPGQFMFRPELHEPGTKVVIGKHYADTGYGQGVAVLRDLAGNPSTAHFVATKLARHFIADDPPRKAVDRIVQAYRSSGGDLPTVYRALIDSPDAWTEPLAKYKTPSDYIVSTFRGMQIPADAGRAPLAPFELLGQRTYAPGSPAGWPDRSADWDGASALMKRIEWADALGQRIGNRRDAMELASQLLGDTLTSATRTAISRAASGSQAVTLLLAAPEFMRR
jgi:uncharacterized protein (DUF1800 family)